VELVIIIPPTDNFNLRLGPLTILNNMYRKNNIISNIDRTPNDYDRVLYWLRVEIPVFLDKISGPDIFIKDFGGVCASHYWKQIAIEMAIQKWPAHKEKLLKLRIEY
jgi:hypothetical protein